jgi:hypothetical protein
MNDIGAQGDNDEKFVIIHDSGEVFVKIGNRLWKADVGVNFPRGTMAVAGILHEEISKPMENKRITASSK